MQIRAYFYLEKIEVVPGIVMLTLVLADVRRQIKVPRQVRRSGRHEPAPATMAITWHRGRERRRRRAAARMQLSEMQSWSAQPLLRA